jgi:hypothetical protein
VSREDERGDRMSDEWVVLKVLRDDHVKKEWIEYNPSEQLIRGVVENKVSKGMMASMEITNLDILKWIAEAEEKSKEVE